MRFLIVLLLIASTAVAQKPAESTTLAKVRAANSLNCGVDFEEVEYSTADAHGNHSRFDLDLCKAVAVAALGPGAHFTAVPYRAEADALNGLKDGDIDVLATATPNFVNTSSGLFAFSRPVLFDFQGFLVNKAFNIHSAKDLAGKKTCFIGGTESEDQLQAYMKRENIKWLPFSFQEEGEMEAAFVTGNCAAITADVTQLGFERIAYKGFAQKCEILPDVIANDPLALTTRATDPRWSSIVNWTASALILAEQSGITQSNIIAMHKSSDDIPTQRILGSIKGYGQFLSLDDTWAYHVIEAVGNYGEIFERTLGTASPMRLDRGPNNLSTHGGLMLADPIR
ncbi:general L-amino acid transport system substrate-binding protein [Granulicella aggregans]|uniref:General L-amino acid transport system substrate-binding protein n=1 Tax=Granulicella aggregans TaxID=474949 RepID=A0A7W7ZJ17_9BACT|nr:transporter substrate-binding domain-containing protein [Granulicella aggregans]MBB5060840.1 general L-amino acid transport system substrate-binding protein [Granulicella aggregans]